MYYLPSKPYSLKPSNSEAFMQVWITWITVTWKILFSSSRIRPEILWNTDAGGPGTTLKEHFKGLGIYFYQIIYLRVICKLFPWTSTSTTWRGKKVKTNLHVREKYILNFENSIWFHIIKVEIKQWGHPLWSNR